MATSLSRSLCACLFVVTTGCIVKSSDYAQIKPASARIRVLAAQPTKELSAKVEEFWREIDGKAPLIEPIDGDTSNHLVTFVWRGDDQTKRVALQSGPLIPGNRNLIRLGDTSLWYLCAVVPSQARFTYFFRINDFHDYLSGEKNSAEDAAEHKLRNDPLNPLKYADDTSYALMPQAPQQNSIVALASGNRGEATASEVQSTHLATSRTVSAYSPLHANPPADSWLLIVLDGAVYERRTGPQALIPTPVILDNLVSQQNFPPIAAVFVHQNDRQHELMGSTAFADFLALEVVPWAQKKWGLTPDPKRVIITGSSAGGLCAAMTAMRHPQVIGNVLSQSGAFYYEPEYADKGGSRPTPFAEPTGWLTRQFAVKPQLPIRFYLEVGTFECENPRYNLVAENRRLRDVLQAKGYSVTYSEYMGDHSYLCWRGTLADGLIALINPASASASTEK